METITNARLRVAVRLTRTNFKLPRTERLPLDLQRQDMVSTFTVGASCHAIMLRLSPLAYLICHPAADLLASSEHPSLLLAPCKSYPTQLWQHSGTGTCCRRMYNLEYHNSCATDMLGRHQETGLAHEHPAVAKVAAQQAA
jgi:hypothetical protein